MKLNIIEYRLIASDALQDAISLCISDSRLDGERGFVFNPLRKEVKALFISDILYYLSLMDNFGKRNIIIHTCNPCHNWRIPHLLPPTDCYSIGDLGAQVIINPDKLRRLFEMGWKAIETYAKGKDQFLTMKCDSYDVMDAIEMLKNEFVGAQFTSEYKQVSPVVVLDNNTLQVARDIKEYPPYVLQKIKTAMGVQSQGRMIGFAH